jgi:acyl carrier protein
MTEEHVIRLILEKLGKFLGRPVTEAELDGGYESLGADSMDMVVLAFELEKILGRKVSPETFLQHSTIRGALMAMMAVSDDNAHA